MKRKLIISLIAVTAFLSAFGGGASLLATLPQHQAEMEPTAIAGSPDETSEDKDGAGSTDVDPKPTYEGNSWGG